MQRFNILFNKSSFRIVSLCTIVLSLSLGGCHQGDVDDTNLTTNANITAQDPPYAYQLNATKETHWYDPLMIVLTERPASEKDLQAQIKARKDAVLTAENNLLEEVRGVIEGMHTSSDRWTVSSMSCGKIHRGSDINFVIEGGLTSLYARHPTISFNDMPLDMCVAKLARESGLQVAQSTRAYNPRVFYTKSDVCIYDALEDILSAHKFRRKMVDTAYKATLRIQDFASHDEFMEAIRQTITTKGKELNMGKPALFVSPHVVPTVRPEESVPEKAPGLGTHAK